MPFFEDFAHLSEDITTVHNIAMKGAKSGTRLPQQEYEKMLANLVCVTKTLTALEEKVLAMYAEKKELSSLVNKAWNLARNEKTKRK